jgi:hypothetical protein
MAVDLIRIENADSHLSRRWISDSKIKKDAVMLNKLSVILHGVLMMFFTLNLSGCGTDWMLNGYPLKYASLIDTGVSKSGEKAVASVHVQNKASQSVSISGAEVSCFCTTVHGLPLTLKPGEERELRVTIDTSGMEQGLNMQRFRFFTDLLSDTPYCLVNIYIAEGTTKDEYTLTDPPSSGSD